MQFALNKLTTQHGIYRCWLNARTQSQVASLWVPAAYRSHPRVSNGIKQKPSRLALVNTSHKSLKKVRPKLEANVSERLVQNAKRDTKRELAMIKAKEKRLLLALKDIIRLSSEYRKFFCSDCDLRYPILEENSSQSFSSIVANLSASMKDIHRTDSPLEWPQIEASEHHYRSLCRCLQSIIMISAAITRQKQYYIKAFSSSSAPTDYDSLNAVREYADITELGVILLAELGKERKIFVESSHRFLSYIQNQVVAQKPPSIEEDAAPRQQPTTLKGWIKSIVDRFPRNSDAARNAQLSLGKSEATLSKMAHEDPDLRVTQKIFRTAVIILASRIHHVDSKATSFDSLANLESKQEISHEKESDGHRMNWNSNPNTAKGYQSVANRMVDLIDRLPLDWVPDPVSQKIIMETLCRSGSPQSARQCYKIYEGFITNQYYLRFSIVLQAFLEAIKHEKSVETRIILIEEVLDILDKHWSKNLRRCHRVERIVHGSLVLHCMALAKVGAIPGMCDKAELITKRSLGGIVYKQLKNELQSRLPRADAQTFPLLNFLAHIYASSGEIGKIEQAKQMLTYMMLYDREDTGRLMSYPELQSINAIIQEIVGRYEGVPKNKIELNSSAQDLQFASDLLDYMLCDPSASCFPSNDTFVLLFNLIFAVEPADLSQRIETLLAKAEMARYLSQPKSDISISLSTYHKVFGGLLQCAKKAHHENDEASSLDFCYRAVRLLDQLDAQTIPLFLSDRSVRETNIKLYDASLRPTRRTYKLVLQICAEGATVTSNPVQDKILGLALNTYKTMITKKDFLPGKDTLLLLKQLESFLHEESSWKREIKSLLDDARK